MIEVWSPQRRNVRRSRITDAQRQRVIAEVCRAARGVERLMPVVYFDEVLAWVGWSRQRQTAIAIEHRPWMRTWVDRNGLLCGFTNVDGIINATTQSAQARQLLWSKGTYNTSANTENWQHLYTLAGFPSASVISSTSGIVRGYDDTSPGALMHGGNVSPMTKHIVSGFVRGGATAAGSINIFVWYDLVVSYGDCAASSTQLNFTNTFPPQRYTGSGDPGLQIMSAQLSAAAGGTNFTQIKYTNQASVSGRIVPSPSMVNMFSGSGPGVGVAALSAFGVTNTDTRTILTPALANGDTGVFQLDSVTMSGTPSPTELISYMLGFQLCWMANHVGTEDTYAFDFVKQTPSLVQVRDGACLQLAQWCAQSSSMWHGSLNVAWA